MTTAARPTFNPAQGGSQKNEGNLAFHSVQYSSQDLPSHKKIKHRQSGQGTVDETRKRNFREELEVRELKHKQAKKGHHEKDDSYGGNQLSIESGSSSRKQRAEPVSLINLDADEPRGDSDRDSSDDDDDEDDTAELMAELNRIKKEREAEQNKKDELKKLDDERIRMENLLHGNPLLAKKTAASSGGDFTVKRRWDDDVVFKNCAKGQDDKNKPKNFINDSLRSEFHKKFMDKYIK
ncbi:Spliceosome-associated protein CWC15-like protein [Hypsibius exemplaris]|uniref:Spliceosome-associated protein CWC15-like protein n=1 Tax=Hypsibius exemplaris TaxID=2072580 RepID=A0A1W0X913_HYPEX|nr:Spliceosome-associated protein CWC15-like protein [Hypsibius exemplaris]